MIPRPFLLFDWRMRFPKLNGMKRTVRCICKSRWRWWKWTRFRIGESVVLVVIRISCYLIHMIVRVFMKDDGFRHDETRTPGRDTRILPSSPRLVVSRHSSLVVSRHGWAALLRLRAAVARGFFSSLCFSLHFSIFLPSSFLPCLVKIRSSQKAFSRNLPLLFNPPHYRFTMKKSRTLRLRLLLIHFINRSSNTVYEWISNISNS